MFKLFNINCILLCGAMLLAACEEREAADPAEEKSKEYAESPILGKWKLMQIREAIMGLKIYDYSNDNITYEFKSNGSLTVATNGKKPLFLNDGSYKFVLDKKPLNPNSNNNEYSFKCGEDGLPYLCKIAGKDLELTRMHVDGAALFLKRL